jgi:hypothetical protein
VNANKGKTMDETTSTTEMDENHRNTLQEILNAIGAMPDIEARIDAFMRGRGIDDPDAEIRALRMIAF